MWILVLLLAFALPADGIDASSLASLPAAYKGRFRPADTYARLWLYDLYHRQTLSSPEEFHVNSTTALDFLWQLHFLGSSHWEDAPLFWIQRADLKTHYHLDPMRARFSYKELKPFVSPVESLKEESNGLISSLQHFEQLEGFTIQAEQSYEQSFEKLKNLPAQEIAWRLETEWPLKTRLSQAGDTFLFLPDRQEPGTWRSLKALKLSLFDSETNQLVPIGNFTPYSDSSFLQIRTLYLQIEKEFGANPRRSILIKRLTGELAHTLHQAYAELAGSPYKEAFQKVLRYPSFNQLEAEKLYFQLPLVEICLVLYGAAACAALLALFQPSRMATWSLISMIGLAFTLHTILLAARCYILMRPPVSNMFETVLYVPWIATFAALCLRFIFKTEWWLFAASLTSLGLLVLLKVTQVNSSLENVQAVLDSQYWLIIHVLMVVGSYGMFLLCGILGHCYLFTYLYHRHETAGMTAIATYILQSMYLGVALLIPGTILGGVWAAESWGRFWDWDPKESWAFISSCVFLLWIHAFRFRYIQNFGLAVGSIAGLQAIIFTWYGVNYILGTGLHSYGFGSGGEHYYYLFLAIEGLILSSAFILYQHTKMAYKVK